MKKVVAVIVALFILGFQAKSYAYTVEKGDTMSEIAHRNGMPLDSLVALNPQIENPNKIYVGDYIELGTGEESEVKEAISIDNNVSQNDKELLARLVRAEARGESYAGKVAVAKVVLNRVESDKFPNTIRDVIYQKNQFSPVNNGGINNSYTEEEMQAVEEAIYSGGDSNGALYFYNPRTATSRWLDSRPTTAVIGNHVFKR